MNKTKSEIRPLYYKLTPHGAVESRSPMVSLIFPSLKDKMRPFKESKKGKKERPSTAAGQKNEFS